MSKPNRQIRSRRRTLHNASRLATGAALAAVVVGCASSTGGSIGGRSSTGEDRPYRITVLSDQLERPWGLAFLPDGEILVTEREGRLRRFRNGSLDPRPIAGVPDVQPGGSLGRRNGLMDIALHPDFAQNRLLYFTYTKAREDSAVTTVLARARYDGRDSLTDVVDIFVADNWVANDISQTSASRIAFGPDGMIYMAIGAPNAPATSGRFSKATGGRAQDPSQHGGKVLRLQEDGSVPTDNPFLGTAGYRPEIYTLGHRNTLGMAVHPQTGEIWVAEAGPRDGDEINVLTGGGNYGWPTVGIGRDYTGDFIGGPAAVGAEAARQEAHRFWADGMEQPFIFWVPAVTPGGITFYTGDRFPEWKGSLFVASLGRNRVERFPFNPAGQPLGAQYLLEELGQRIRDIREGPDGLLYVLTDHDRVWSPGDTSKGYLLRLEPAE